MSKEPLKGWKAIATLLGVSVRTAAPWERELELPIQRVPGAHSDIVYADPDELEHWRAGRTDPEAEAATGPATGKVVEDGAEPRPDSRTQGWKVG